MQCPNGHSTYAPRRALCICLTLAVLLPWAWPAWGQPPADIAPPEPAAVEGEKPADEKLADDEEGEPPLREQTIYIPYKKLRDTFEKQGRGVFIPYDQFRKLWDSARKSEAAAPAVAPPVSAVITEIVNLATVVEEVMQVESTLSIELLTPGWHHVPLRLGDAAVQSATIDGKPARLVVNAEGYRLLVHREQQDDGRLELKLKYAKTFVRAPGQNRFEVQAPQASVNRWQVRIPEAGVKVQVYPLLAATEVPLDQPEAAADKPDPDKPAPEATTVLAFVGAAPTVRIEWTPKAEGAAGLSALATATAEQELQLGEGVLRTTVRLAYEISRSELAQLQIEVPADQKVAGVFNGNVKQWKVAEEAGVQKITVDLFEPASSRQEVTVELEQFLEEAAQRVVTVPVVRAVGVARQQGIVLVRLAEGLRGQAESRSGLLQLDADDIPKPLAQRGPWPFAYRYASLPFELKLNVEKETPRVQVDQLVEAYLEPEKLTIDLLALYTIERAGVFELRLSLPAELEVRRVQGRAVGDSQAAVVDAHRVEEADDARQLVVSLSRKAIGKVGLWIELEKRLQDPNLLSPTGTAALLEIASPAARSQGVERATGRLVIYSPESLRVVPKTVDALRAVSIGEALQDIPSTRDGRFSTQRPTLAYAFIDQPEPLPLQVERRKPHITVRQLLVGNVEAGVVKYSATFFVDILYSGAESLRIDLPTQVAGLARNVTTSIRDQVSNPPPEDLEAGYVAWQFAGETELNGSFSIVLNWEEPIEKLDIGSQVKLAVPRLIPRGVDRAWGQIVLAKAETIDLTPADQPEGLQPIDPQHDLMPGASVPQAALGFEFHDPWKLNLQATRFELQTVKTTSIERAVVRMVATRSEMISVQAIYRLRSSRQRLELVLPEDVGAGGIAFDAQPLRINGRAVSLERGADNRTFYVPLVGLQPETPLVLELRYTQPGGPGELLLPSFPGEPAVQQVYLGVYLPREWAFLGSRGPWTDEVRWRGGMLGQRVAPKQNDHQLIHWVTEGVPVEGNLLQTFSTDGRFFLFSTLRPLQQDALRLWTMDENWLIALTLLCIVLGGLALVAYGLRVRLTAVALLVVVVVLVGVFAPTFASQVLDWKLTTALLLVALVWLVKWLLVDRPSLATVAGWFPTRRQTAASGAGGTPQAIDPATPPAPPDASLSDKKAGESGNASQGGPTHE